eukprot:718347-Pleurochrysis_carterae.AAC.1
MEGLYVDGTVIQGIVEFAKNTHTWRYYAITSQGDIERYVDNAYSFFGLRLQLHMLTELSHEDQRVARHSAVLEALYSDERIFGNLDMHDVASYMREEKTAKLVLYNGTTVDINRLNRFVQRHPWLHMWIRTEFSKRKRHEA